MTISREYYSHRVYFKSLQEYEQVRATAALDGMGRKVSSWIRDLVIAEIRRRRPGLVLDSDEQTQLSVPELPQSPIVDPNWENKLVPHPTTGELVRAGDLNLKFNEEEEDISIEDILK